MAAYEGMVRVLLGWFTLVLADTPGRVLPLLLVDLKDGMRGTVGARECATDSTHFARRAAGPERHGGV